MQAYYSQNYAGENEFAAFLTEYQVSDNRDENDVDGIEKARFAGSSIGQAYLNEDITCKVCDTAERGGDEKLFKISFSIGKISYSLSCQGGFSLMSDKKYQRNHGQCTYAITCSHE